MIVSNSALYDKYIGVDKIPKLEFVRIKKRIISLVKSGHIDTRPIKNKAVGILIEIPLIGIEHSLGLRCTLNKVKSLTVIREIIKTASIVSIERDKNISENNVIIFDNIVMIDAVKWRVVMIVKQGKNGKFYYHHDLAKIKKA